MANEKVIIDVIKQTVFLLGGLDIIISNAVCLLLSFPFLLLSYL